MKKLNYAGMFTLRKDGRYVFRWTDDAGKRHALYDRDPERLWHKINDPRPADLSVYADTWYAAHREAVSYKTAEAYRAPLKRILTQFGSRDISSITPAELSAFLRMLGSQGYARRTVQMHRDILNMIYTRAIADGALRHNPMDAVAMPINLRTTQRSLPDDEAIEAVRASAGVPFALFALICLYAGLRRGEALALRYEDIDRACGVIHVTKAVEYIGNNPHIKPPKTKAGYRDAVLLDALAELIPDKGSGYIFARPDGQPLTKIQYRKRWIAYCKTIGHNITAHQLRHGFATILYEAGIPDKDAQELLGHSSITVTRNVYTHIRQSRRDATSRQLNEYLNRSL